MFNEVIVGFDDCPRSHDAVALARQLADPRRPLIHVHVSPDSSRDFGAYGEGLLTVSSSSVGRGLHHIANERAADLLVVGSSSRGTLGRVLVSDHAHATLNGSPCAVAIAPRGYAASSRTLGMLGVGCNDSIGGQTALSIARELAVIHGAKDRGTVDRPNRERTLARARARRFARADASRPAPSRTRAA